VGRSISWLYQNRRLRVRWERRDDIHQAFLSLACRLICFKEAWRAAYHFILHHYGRNSMLR
jgi:hypothetical protein